MNKMKYGILALCLMTSPAILAEQTAEAELEEAYESLRTTNAVMGKCIELIEIDGLTAFKESEPCKQTMKDLPMTNMAVEKAQQFTTGKTGKTANNITTLAGINSEMETYISQAEYLKSYIDIVIQNMLQSNNKAENTDS